MDKRIALQIHNLGFKFRPHDRCFFKEFSMTLEMGKLHFLRGENGAGKSTLLRVLQGRIDKSERSLGTIEIKGHSVKLNEVNLPINRSFFNSIAMVPQKFDEMLVPQLSFEHNLSLASMGTFPSLGRLPGHQLIPDFIERFNIDRNKPVYLLSGGQRQVLSMLMALQKNASVLLLDEPTAALDQQNADMVMMFLAELVSKTDLSVLIICHDKELVLRYAKNGYFELLFDREKEHRTLRLVA